MMTTRRTQSLAVLTNAVSRSSIVWGFTVCFIYGPTGCTLGAATLLLLAGIPAVALASWLWVVAAHQRARSLRHRQSHTRHLWASATGALAGAGIPLLALAALPAAPNVLAAALRLFLGTTALLAPVWVWLGSRFGPLFLTTGAARLSQSSTLQRLSRPAPLISSV